METTVTVAIVSGSFALSGTIITAILALLRDRLDKRKVAHEEKRWLLELHSSFERTLYEVRLKKYPAIFRSLEVLSHYRQPNLTNDITSNLADKLNSWGYDEAGLCMPSETRDSVFRLRRKLLKFSSSEKNYDVYMDVRTDLIEQLRRDINHSKSRWRETEPLLDDIAKRSNVKKENANAS